MVRLREIMCIFSDHQLTIFKFDINTDDFFFLTTSTIFEINSLS